MHKEAGGHRPTRREKETPYYVQDIVLDRWLNEKHQSSYQDRLWDELLILRRREAPSLSKQEVIALSRSLLEGVVILSQEDPAEKDIPESESRRIRAAQYAVRGNPDAAEVQLGRVENGNFSSDTILAMAHLAMAANIRALGSDLTHEGRVIADNHINAGLSLIAEVVADALPRFPVSDVS